MSLKSIAVTNYWYLSQQYFCLQQDILLALLLKRLRFSAADLGSPLCCIIMSLFISQWFIQEVQIEAKTDPYHVVFRSVSFLPVSPVVWLPRQIQSIWRHLEKTQLLRQERVICDYYVFWSRMRKYTKNNPQDIMTLTIFAQRSLNPDYTVWHVSWILTI